VSDISANLKSFYDGEVEDRAGRPLGDWRTELVRAFTGRLRANEGQTLLEVGCGAGRDALILSESGWTYTGVDLSSVAVRTCRELGLHAIEASATRLPFAADSFDAAWSMSTLMHLPGDGFGRAIQELRRVVRPGGVIEIGVWGHTTDREWTSPDGRYFKHRSDERFQLDLQELGQVVAFETWDWFDEGGHYQWARVVAR
jgi:SAM-dependent methyltransferase